MKTPEKLGSAGKKAWNRALRSIEGLEDEDRLYDSAERYARQTDLADKARRAWRREGEPLISTNPNGAIGKHPLLKVIEDADKLANRLGEPLGIEAQKQKHRGPDPKAVVQPQASPAVKLRAVS